MSGCSGAATPALPAGTVTALHALQLADSASGHVNTLSARIDVQSTGTTQGGLVGTVQIQQKPTKLIEVELAVNAAKAPSTQLDEILTDSAVYFKDPAFARSSGKVWIKADLSQLSSKSGVTLGTLLQNLEGSNPLDQTRLFSSSTDVRLAGSAVVNGIATNVYSGSYSPSTALAQLSPQQRKLLGTMLHAIGTNPVRFRVWIDARHLIRQAEIIESVRGETVTTDFGVTSINQPVRVLLPDPHQVAPLPKA
ncbi:MAG TPA: hypothetical protein VNF47_05305 [Streptosporangiaceae bacterium]|nr:hypothetical protein [Streptosporangiaceae bacterium]